MPLSVTFSKRHASDRGLTGASGSRELSYVGVATGTGLDDVALIIDEAEAQLPGAFDGMSSRQIQVEPIDATRGLWDVTAVYRPQSKEQKEPPAAGAAGEYEFEVATTSLHITQGKQTIGGYAPSGGTTPTFSGAIGVTEDGVDGCDILVPESRWTETHYLADATVTAAYRKQLRELVGKVNNAGFRDHAAGEVLLVGVRGGKRRSDGVWQLTFSFAFSPNVTGLSIGAITGIAKGGWEYLWVWYESVVSGGTIVQQPANAYVERVYDSANFALLGIGT